jgi:putative tryptophan/tyrosine transport system substrate-binding protein
MSTRRQFITATVAWGAALATPGTFAQNGTVAKIGMLLPRPLKQSNYAVGIVSRLEELGYRQGSGMTFAWRSADGFVDRYAALARQLVALDCDLVFAVGPEHTVRAVKEAGAKAVVFLAVDYDPVEKGIVKSLRQPGAGITGIFMQQQGLVMKRLEILREVLPGARRFLVLSDVYSRDQVAAAKKAAAVAQVELQFAEFGKPPYDYEAAFSSAGSVDGVVALASPVFATDAQSLAVLLAKRRLPGIGSSRNHVDAGLLFSFSADTPKVSRRTAELGIRMLKAPRGTEIPVEQADEFELAINAKTAKALGVKVPESVLARATRIVQ